MVTPDSDSPESKSQPDLGAGAEANRGSDEANRGSGEASSDSGLAPGQAEATLHPPDPLGLKRFAQAVAGAEYRRKNLSRRKQESGEYDKVEDAIRARLRAARLRAEMTADQLARLTGIPRTDLRYMEDGKIPLALTRIRLIGAVLGVPLKDFFDDQLELPPARRPVDPGDPNYITDPEEKKLLAAFRALARGKERRLAIMVANAVRLCRDRRYDNAARVRQRDWLKPPKEPPAAELLPGRPPPAPERKHVDPKWREKLATEKNYDWMREHAGKYPDRWVALRAGVLIDYDADRIRLVERIVRKPEKRGRGRPRIGPPTDVVLMFTGGATKHRFSKPVPIAELLQPAQPGNPGPAPGSSTPPST